MAATSSSSLAESRGRRRRAVHSAAAATVTHIRTHVSLDQRGRMDFRIRDRLTPCEPTLGFRDDLLVYTHVVEFVHAQQIHAQEQVQTVKVAVVAALVAEVLV